MSQLRPESIAVAAGRPERTPRAPLAAPIVLSAPFHHGPDDNHYLRQGSNATIEAFEDALGALEGGTALAFASGMAATTAVVEAQPVGTVAIVPTVGYTGTQALFATQQELGRMTIRAVDISDSYAVTAALPGADLLWLESITNPLLEVPDLSALIGAARGAGVNVCVDATFSTPMTLRALDLGADVVMHSATKYLSGHSDVLMGALVTRSPRLGALLRARRDLTGALPGALEAFLALRGLRTLPLRMQRAQANAATLATRLVEHPRVTGVRYPGLPDDPFHERATRLFTGYGAMISFEVEGTEQDAERVCDSVRLICHATSLGGVESLIERRARHAGDAAFGTPPTLLRLSVGIEHVEDLWDDLAQALG